MLAQVTTAPTTTPTSTPTAAPTSWPTSLPTSINEVMDRFNLTDPTTRLIVIGAVAILFLLLAMKIIARRRQAAAAARYRADLHQAFEGVRLQQEEVKRLADQIAATSSTGRIAGFAIVRQVETVFSEPKASSVSAVDLVKALAVQKGANALINLETRQLPGGKWVASGDAVVVKLYGQREQKQS
jgi:hypothetical protein